jgi:hypothetical protein
LIIKTPLKGLQGPEICRGHRGQRTEDKVSDRGDRIQVSGKGDSVIVPSKKMELGDLSKFVKTPETLFF